MLNTIASFFESHFTPPDERTREHSASQLQLASAALMIELCKADQTIDDSETVTLVNILKERYALNQKALDELLALAEQEAKEATSLYQFTSLINENFDYQEKTQLLRNLWELAYADGQIDRYEDHLIRKLADLLYLSHGDFIKTKLAARDS